MCAVYDSVPGIDEREFTALASLQRNYSKEIIFGSVFPSLICACFVLNQMTIPTVSAIFEPSRQGAEKIVKQIIRVVAADTILTQVSQYFF